MKSEFPGAVPEIPVSDIDKAAAYYCDCLGFNLDFGGGELGLAGISRGACRMFLATREFREQFGNDEPIVIWLNLSSNEEVDELYRLWNGSKAKLLSTPESKPWGLHEFLAADLDGNLFRVFYDFGTAERSKGA
jgi:predicted lactoylglutathione lyase